MRASMWAGTMALQAWTPDQTKQARVISAPTLPSSSSIYIIPRKKSKTNKQTNKQTNKTKTTQPFRNERSQMNINFFRLFIKCFWWLLKQEAWKERKNYTEQLLTFLWAYMYTIKNYTSRKNKTNKLHI